MSGEYVAWRHRVPLFTACSNIKLKCPVKHPPGDEIYRDGKLSIFEVDGRKNPVGDGFVKLRLGVLSESLSSRQNVSRPQNAVLRRRALPFLCSM